MQDQYNVARTGLTICIVALVLGLFVWAANWIWGVVVVPKLLDGVEDIRSLMGTYRIVLGLVVVVRNLACALGAGLVASNVERGGGLAAGSAAAFVLLALIRVFYIIRPDHLETSILAQSGRYVWIVVGVVALTLLAAAAEVISKSRRWWLVTLVGVASLIAGLGSGVAFTLAKTFDMSMASNWLQVVSVLDWLVYIIVIVVVTVAILMPAVVKLRPSRQSLGHPYSGQ